MAKSKSSRAWLREHFDDPYVKQAKARDYRSRAAFKLLEIQHKDRILRPNMTVVDLGAAPGGWSQVAKELVGDKGMVIALDILPMDPIAGVHFIQGDFREPEAYQALLDAIEERPVDLVISDMAPNISGMKAVDQPRAMYLVELAVELVRQVLAPGGDLLVKVFQGAGFDELIKELRGMFAKVIIRKPQASRARSPEVYVLARNYRI